MQPAASAGAVFQVESMNGAFHGVITTAGPLGMRTHAVPRAVRLPRPLLVGDREVRVRAVVARAAGDHPRPERAEQHRHVGALDGCEPLDVGVDQVGEAVQRSARPAAPSAAQPGNASVAAATARSASLLAAARDLGERPRVDRAQVDEASRRFRPARRR